MTVGKIDYYSGNSQGKWVSLVAHMVKILPAMQETWVSSLGWEYPLEEGMGTHSSILAWRISHGQRSLAGYSPWGCKESDMTERRRTAQSEKVLWNCRYELHCEG